MSKQTDAQRRKFLQQFAVVLGGSTLLATQSKLELIKTALAADYSGIQDHKSLVCIFLSGGNDSFNMFIPQQLSEYNHYADIRGNLAIPRSAEPLNGATDYFFHPSMQTAVTNLYNQQNLAVISNVGNLFQPLTRAQFLDYESGNSSIRIPQGLFSHSHQQETWQTNRSPQSGTTPPGWGGLLGDLLNSSNQFANLPPTASLSGANPWQSGNATQPFNIGANGLSNFSYLADNNWPPQQIPRTNTWREILQLERQNVLKKQVASHFTTTRQRIAEIQNALSSNNAQTITTPYPNPQTNSLAADLKMVARLIEARERLGLKRQIFFVRYGAWDTHGNQLPTHASLLATLNDALAAFYQTTVELEVADSVTTFSASDFGRTSTSNGDGTDHGWGGHQLVMGGAVKGGQVHGSLPDINPGSNDDSGSAGRIIPTISVDQYGATLAKWMGVSDSDLNAIFPNLNQFSERDLGFME